MAPLIKTNWALTCIDDTILQAEKKAEMFKNNPKYHSSVRAAGLKVSPEQTNFFLQKVDFLVHIVMNKGMQPIAKRVHHLKYLKTPQKKRDAIKAIGNFGGYSH